MVKFIIVRHGFSVGNKGNIFTGQLDLSLDEVGFSQAEFVAKYVLENFEVDEVYSSELCRAYDTVLPIAKALSKEIKRRKDLNEVDVGAWQGKTFDEVKEEYPEGFELYKRSPGTVQFDGGESYSDVRERAVNEFHKIAEENEGKTVVVATHGGVIRNLLAAWLGIPVERITEVPRASNASITVAEYENGKANILIYGYTGHLEDKTTEVALN